MMRKHSFRFAAVLLAAVMLIAGGATAMSVIAGTQTVSNAEYPVCTAPCECISESEAATRWGAEGYEMCSKTICGQTADAMVQFYCIHQKGAAVAPAAVTTAAAATATATLSPEPVKVPETSAAMTSPPLTTPAPVATKKSPAGAAGILAVTGAVLLAAAGARNH